MQIIIIKYIGHGSRLAGDTTSRLQVARSKSSKDGFFGFLSEKKELTSWWSVALLSTKNRRGELWDSRLTPQLE